MPSYYLYPGSRSGQGCRSRYSEMLWPGRSEVQTSVGARGFLFTILDQVSPETHPTCSTAVNGAHSVVLKTHLHLALRLRMSWNIPVLRPCASHGMWCVTFTFTKNSFVHCKMHISYLSVLNIHLIILRFILCCLLRDVFRKVWTPAWDVKGPKHLSFVACWTLSGYTPDIGMPQASCVLYLLLLSKT
jgi:hypothetical protein